MKRCLLLCFIVLSSCLFAEEYAYLTFSMTNGDARSFSVADLRLSVNGSDLMVTNASQSVSLVLSQIQSMSFSSADLTALDEVEWNMDAPVQVSGLNGRAFGLYDTAEHALMQLQPGIYVFTQGSNSQTIILQ